MKNTKEQIILDYLTKLLHDYKTTWKGEDACYDDIGEAAIAAVIGTLESEIKIYKKKVNQ